MINDDGNEGDGLRRGEEDIPFEFEGKVARAGAVAEAGDVERGAAAARHSEVTVRVERVMKR